MTTGELLSTITTEDRVKLELRSVQERFVQFPFSYTTHPFNTPLKTSRPQKRKDRVNYSYQGNSYELFGRDRKHLR